MVQRDDLVTGLQQLRVDRTQERLLDDGRPTEMDGTHGVVSTWFLQAG